MEQANASMAAEGTCRHCGLPVVFVVGKRIAFWAHKTTGLRYCFNATHALKWAIPVEAGVMAFWGEARQHGR